MVAKQQHPTLPLLYSDQNEKWSSMRVGACPCGRDCLDNAGRPQGHAPTKIQFAS